MTFREVIAWDRAERKVSRKQFDYEQEVAFLRNNDNQDGFLIDHLIGAIVSRHKEWMNSCHELMDLTSRIIPKNKWNGGLDLIDLN